MARGLKELFLDDYLDLPQINENDQTHSKVLLRNQRGDFYLRQLLQHPFYDYLMAFVIVSSSITLGLSLETDDEYLNDYFRQTAIYAADEILIAILFLEFLFKFYLDSFHYWFDWTNLYDFMIILFGFIEIISTFFSRNTNSTVTNVLKGFRLLQLIRLYRIIKLSEGLQVLVKALIKTVLTYTFTVVVLVFLIVYVVAVTGQMLYGRAESR